MVLNNKTNRQQCDSHTLWLDTLTFICVARGVTGELVTYSQCALSVVTLML